MTVPTSTAKSGPYAGAGTTGPFTVGFRFLENSHLQVIRTSTLGIDSTLALTTDYTVTGAGGASGTVTLVAALASGEKLTIIRNVPFTQDADYVQNDAFPAESHERALDKLTMEVQQVAEEVGRALTLPATVSGVSTIVPAPQANSVLAWNPAANALQNITTAELATIVAYGTAASDIFTGTGSQVLFVLSSNPGALNNLDVSIGGVTQLPGTDYTWSSGTTVTFTTAPPLGAKVLIRYMQALALGTADAGSVQYTPAGTGAVATTVQAKLLESVSVLDFGADPTGVADSTAEFAAALATGKSVFIPEGTYLITSSLTVSTNAQMIYGVGYGKSIVQRGNDTSFIIFNVTAAYGVEFHNFKIQEQNVSSTNTGSFITCAVGGGTDVLIQGMWFWYGYLHVRCLQGTSNITFSNTVFETARKGAIYSSSSARNKIVGCTFWKNSADFSNPSDRGYAIFLAKDGGYSFGSDNWNIVGNYFAENVYGPFLLAGQSEGVQITGNFFEIASQVDNGQKSDIELTSCTRWSIVGNTSDSIFNSYLPGGRGSKYVVDLSGGGNAEIAIIGNGFEAGVSGTINDPSRITDTAGAYPIAWSMPVQINSSGTGITMSAQIATATRVGKLETINSSTTLTSKGASSGAVRLGPLPHTPTSMGFGSGYITSSTGITTPIYFQLNTDGYVYPLYAVSSNVLDTNIANNSVIVFSGTYPIA